MDKIINKVFNDYSEINDPVISLSDKLYNENLQSLFDRTEDVLFKKAIAITDHLNYWVVTCLDNDKELYEMSKQFRNENGDYYPEFVGSIVVGLMKHRQTTHFGAYNARD